MFELIAVVFEDVEPLVLDFPSRPAAGDDLGDIVLGDGKAGRPGHGICDLSLGVDNLEADPVDQDGACGTIRLELLKIGALVKTSFRRIQFSIASAFPYIDDYAAAWAALRSPV